MKILVVEDEAALAGSVLEYLKKEGFACEWAATFHEAEEKACLHEYDCVLVDIGLPGGNGLDVIAALKERGSDAGVIIVSARNSLDDKIQGLDLGADDYLTKPFHLSELNSRIKSLLRRRLNKGMPVVEFNEISIHTGTFEVKVRGTPLELTKKEFDLLLYFVTSRNRVLTKEAIAEHLWGEAVDSMDSFDFIYTHIKNLRKKLLQAGGQDYIQSVYGMGYKFTDNL